MNANEQGDNMSKGTRYNEGKTQLSMILEARNALNGCAKVLEFGKAKYDRGNWRNGLNHTETCDSLLRHLSAYLSGEDLDPESELPHVDHVLCNALFLAEMLRTHSELDDRSKLNNEDNKESNLSEKVWESPLSKQPLYHQDDVKEFIKELKFGLEVLKMDDASIIFLIDKLAGEKLI